MAAALATEINAIQRDGTTLDNKSGSRDTFFKFNANRAAASIELTIDDPKDIAASSRRGQPGNNENVLAMARLQNEKLFEKATPLSHNTTVIWWPTLVLKRKWPRPIVPVKNRFWMKLRKKKCSGRCEP